MRKNAQSRHGVGNPSSAPSGHLPPGEGKEALVPNLRDGFPWGCEAGAWELMTCRWHIRAAPDRAAARQLSAKLTDEGRSPFHPLCAQLFRCFMRCSMSCSDWMLLTQ